MLWWIEGLLCEEKNGGPQGYEDEKKYVMLMGWSFFRTQSIQDPCLV
jgi:hypothetical protein